jgi:WD40 repeat protein
VEEIRAPLGAGEKGLQVLGQLLQLPDGAYLEENKLVKFYRNQKSALLGVKRSIPSNRQQYLYLYLGGQLTVRTAVASLNGCPWIECAEPDYIMQAGSVLPNDTEFDAQWNLRNMQYVLGKTRADIHAPEAWAITTGSSNVIVAVLDGGVDSTSPDLAGRFVTGWSAYDGSTIDLDGHGTGCALVLGANGNDSNHLAGVDWQCRIMPVRVANPAGTAYWSNIREGIWYAMDHGAKVISFSFGGGEPTATKLEVIGSAIAQGVLFVTITHNDATNIIRFPGSMPEAITVGASTAADRRADFSNYGPAIDLVAPGEDIPVLDLTNRLRFGSGTSLACPAVAGVCALLAALHPSIDQAHARALLCAGADDQVGDSYDTPGFDKFYGWGRLNAFSTLRLAQLNATNTTDVQVLRHILRADQLAHPELYADMETSGVHVETTPTARVWETAWHRGAVNSVVWSPDATVLATASEDGTVKVWRSGNGSLQHTLTRHERDVMAVAFSRDGTQLASGGADNRICLWDTGSGQLLRSFVAHSNWVSSLAFLSEGWLVSAGYDGLIKIWEPNDGRLLKVLAGHSGYVTAVAASADGRRLISADGTGSIKVWGLPSGEFVRGITGPTASILGLAISQDGNRIVAGTLDRQTWCWQTDSGSVIWGPQA